MIRQPERVEEVEALVRSHQAVVIRGAGTKSPVDREAEETLTLDLSRLAGVVEYSPEECVFTALAGTSLATLAATLSAHGQYLPFDPPLAAAGATLGGTVATGVSGPGRYRYGGVRDFVVGARVIDGEGRSIRSGGKVVKNAAGFLLHHGIVGSRGRLAVIAELTFKVFPAPEARVTLEFSCGTLEAILATLRRIDLERADLDAVDFDARGTLWIRIAGRSNALGGRVGRVRRAAAMDSKLIAGEPEQALWAGVNEFAWASTGSVIVKVPVTPDQLAHLSAEAGQVRFSCGGALAWIAWAGEIAVLSSRLASIGLGGVVVRGSSAGTVVGVVADNPFEARLRQVLDPMSRFHAARDSRS